jgi:hypothetical protein
MINDMRVITMGYFSVVKNEVRSCAGCYGDEVARVLIRIVGRVLFGVPEGPSFSIRTTSLKLCVQ